MRHLFFLLFPLLLSAKPYIDPATYLMWQDVPENRGVLFTWEESKEHCEALDESGYEDWWLPSEQELISIVELSRPQNRKIQAGFVYYKPAGYWSASTYSWNAPHAWVISFKNGASYSAEKESRHFVRCVRCSDFKLCIEKFYQK